jgi:hypothetical protein
VRSPTPPPRRQHAGPAADRRARARAGSSRPTKAPTPPRCSSSRASPGWSTGPLTPVRIARLSDGTRGTEVS